jgi:Sulfite exporter TauE/SafE
MRLRNVARGQWSYLGAVLTDLGGCKQVGLVPETGDIEWTRETTLTYPVLCSLAGVIAGMFGVGGGIVKGPLMLHLGMLPEVAAATSATMIFFTACSRPLLDLLGL